MHRLLVILILGVLFLSLIGCSGSGGNSDFTIKVTGTNGLSFSGSYMGVTSGGTTSKSVDGTVPATYTVSGSIVSCSFQKKSESGSLAVQILKDNKVVKESDTTAAYGVVTAATN